MQVMEARDVIGNDRVVAVKVRVGSVWEFHSFVCGQCMLGKSDQRVSAQRYISLGVCKTATSRDIFHRGPWGVLSRKQLFSRQGECSGRERRRANCPHRHAADKAVTPLCLFAALLSFTFESTLEAISSRCIIVYLFPEMAIGFIKQCFGHDES